MYHTILGKESSLFSIAMDSFYGLNEKTMVSVRTSFDLDPTQEWIQAHVAQTMNL